MTGQTGQTGQVNILEKVGANLHPSVQIVPDHIDLPVNTARYIYINMKLLQANLQSLNTSRKLTDLVIQRHRPDVLLLQELWSSNDTVFIKDFAISAIKLRVNKMGGGVAICTHKKVKCVRLQEYETDGVEVVCLK